jgi:hypothetical protein
MEHATLLYILVSLLALILILAAILYFCFGKNRGKAILFSF